jgi:hypothetical protein
MSGCVAQASPATQVTHEPPLHTSFDPQAVPLARGAPSTQMDVPVAQDVAPAWQSGSGWPEQA